MFMKRFLIAALASTVAFLTPAQAGGPIVIGGQVTHEGIQRLTSQVNWYQSLGQAESEARRSGKMIFWLHILGQIDGAT
jgi:hypothetical protein